MNAPSMTETPTEWMLRHINAFAESFPNWNMDTPAARLRLAQHLGGNWEMVQQAQAASRPKAILPDVRDVIQSYEGIGAGLRARILALADLLEGEINKDADALEEMRRTLEEIREEIA